MANEVLLQRELEVLHDRFKRMETDFRENHRIAEKLGAELERERNEKDGLQKQLRAQELRYAAMSATVQAQDERIQNSENEKRKYTEGLRSEIETLSAQLQSTTAQRNTAERTVQELQAEQMQLRSEVASKNSELLHKVEAARSEAKLEARTTMDEKERILKQRQEGIQASNRELQTTATEQQGRLERIREELQNLQHRLDEKDQVLHRRDATIEKLEQQLNEQRRTASMNETALQTELATVKASKEQLEKTNATHALSIQREVERKSHEIELFEERITSMRQQHEVEMRRRSEDKDESQRHGDEKHRQLTERNRVLEAKQGELTDECDRLRRALEDSKSEVKKLRTETRRLEDSSESARRTIDAKDVELERMAQELRRTQKTIDESNRESEVLRASFEKRDWVDKTVRTQHLSNRVAAWGELADLTTRAAENRREPPLSPHNVRGGNVSAIAASPRRSDSMTVELLTDIKDQLSRQQQQPSSAPATPRGISDAGSSSAGLAQTVALLQQELQSVKSRHDDDKHEMSRKVEEAQREVDRQRRKVERLSEKSVAFGAAPSFIGGPSPIAGVPPMPSMMHAAPPVIAEESIVKSADPSDGETESAGGGMNTSAASDAWLRRADTTRNPTPNAEAPRPTRKVTVSPTVKRLQESRKQLAEPFNIASPSKSSAQRSPYRR